VPEAHSHPEPSIPAPARTRLDDTSNHRFRRRRTLHRCRHRPLAHWHALRGWPHRRIL